MTARRAWLDGEPSLEELLADPIVDALLRRDGLTRDDVWRAVESARGRLCQDFRAPSAA